MNKFIPGETQSQRRRVFLSASRLSIAAIFEVRRRRCGKRRGTVGASARPLSRLMSFVTTIKLTNTHQKVQIKFTGLIKHQKGHSNAGASVTRGAKKIVYHSHGRIGRTGDIILAYFDAMASISAVFSERAKINSHLALWDRLNLSFLEGFFFFSIFRGIE